LKEAMANNITQHGNYLLNEKHVKTKKRNKSYKIGILILAAASWILIHPLC